jgi:hypothetical protein
MTVHPVAGNIRTYVGTRSELSRFWITRLKHFQQWTRFGIALTEEQKIIGKSTRDNGQVCLRVARRKTSRETAPLAGANALAELHWRQPAQVGQRKFNGGHDTLLTCSGG